MLDELFDWFEDRIMHREEPLKVNTKVKIIYGTYRGLNAKVLWKSSLYSNAYELSILVPGNSMETLDVVKRKDFEVNE